MSTKTWGALQGNDWIVCPGDAQPERVVSNQKYVTGKRFIRTHRHDHFKPTCEEVEVTEKPEWAR